MEWLKNLRKLTPAGCSVSPFHGFEQFGPMREFIIELFSTYYDDTGCAIKTCSQFAEIIIVYCQTKSANWRLSESRLSKTLVSRSWFDMAENGYTASITEGARTWSSGQDRASKH